MTLTIANLWDEPAAPAPLVDPAPPAPDDRVHPDAREADIDDFTALPPRRQRAWRWYVARLTETGLNQAAAELEAWRREGLGEQLARAAGWAYAD